MKSRGKLSGTRINPDNTKSIDFEPCFVTELFHLELIQIIAAIGKKSYKLTDYYSLVEGGSLLYFSKPFWTGNLMVTIGVYNNQVTCITTTIPGYYFAHTQSELVGNGYEVVTAQYENTQKEIVDFSGGECPLTPSPSLFYKFHNTIELITCTVNVPDNFSHNNFNYALTYINGLI